MKNLALFISLSMIFITVDSFAQQKEFQWRIGFSGGYATYLGDLMPEPVEGVSNRGRIYHMFTYNRNYSHQPSFKVTLERQLSPSTGLSVHYGQYFFGMSDRYVDRKGNLYLENPNFPRSLNFRNRSKEIGLSMVFRSDNDRLLRADAFIAPYLSLGVGLLRFDVWGDLLDQNSEKYDNTIPAIIHDGVYETYLPEWETELDGGYSRLTFTTSLGLGFRLRLTRTLEAFAQSDFIFTFSDFLDDVSGRYREEFSSSFQEYASKPGFNVVDPEYPFRGNPNGLSDKIFFHGIGVKYNFGASNRSFRGPRVSAGFVQVYSPAPVRAVVPESSVRTTTQSQEAPAWPAPTMTDQVLTWQKLQSLDTLKYENQILAWNQEIQNRQNLTTAGKVKESDLIKVQTQLERQYQTILNDNVLSASDKETFLRNTDQNRFDVRYSLDSLRRKERELKVEIDSISSLKRDHRLVPTVMVIYADTNSIRSAEEISPATAMSDKQESSENEESVKARTTSETNEASPTAASQSQTVTSSEDQARIQNLEAENRYLNNERERLIAESAAKDSKKKQKKEKPPKVKTKNTTEQVVAQDQDSPENETRRQRRRRLAAAGAVVGTVAILSDGDDGKEADATPQTEPVPPTEEQIEAISLAFAGLSKGAISPVVSENQQAEAESDVQEDTPPVRRRALPENYFQPIETVFFDSNQRVPAKTETDKLKELAEFVRNNEGYGLMLTGYTDNTGSLSYNLKLAEDRIANVAEALEAEYGISKDLIRSQSGGKVLRGTQKTNNAQDRKVEVTLILLDEKED